MQYSTVAIDSGYTKICGSCAKRWGGPVYGERDVEITRCETHVEKTPEGAVLLHSYRSYRPLTKI